MQRGQVGSQSGELSSDATWLTSESGALSAEHAGIEIACHSYVCPMSMSWMTAEAQSV